jgi:hypothetical protein
MQALARGAGSFAQSGSKILFCVIPACTTRCLVGATEKLSKAVQYFRTDLVTDEKNRLRRHLLPGHPRHIEQAAASGDIGIKICENFGELFYREAVLWHCHPPVTTRP